MQEKLLQIEPDLRCSVRAAAALPYWHLLEAEVCLAAVRAERGLFTLYPNFGNATLMGSWSEEGVHSRGSPGLLELLSLVPLSHFHERLLRFS